MGLLSFLSFITARSLRPGYSIIFQMGKIDISQHIERLRIVNSMNTIYPVFFLEFSLDSKDLTIEQLYGQKTALMSVNYMGMAIQVKEEYQVDLLILHIDIPMANKMNNNKPDYRGQTGRIIAIPQISYEALSASVDKIVQYTDGGKIPLDVAKEIIQESYPTVILNCIEDNKNDDKIMQCKIEQDVSVNKAIKFLDKEYGLFKGQMFFYSSVDEDGPTINLWDLNKKITSQAEYKVTFLSLSNPESNMSGDPGHYFTMSPLQAENKGTSHMLSHSYEVAILTKPLKTGLFIEQKFNMPKVFENLGIFDGENKEQQYNPVAQKKTVYTAKNVTGSDTDSPSFVTGDLAKFMSKMSQTSFRISGGIYLNKLTKIGVAIELDPELDEYQQYKGKYIVHSSDINIERNSAGNFEATADIKCFRGNTEM